MKNTLPRIIHEGTPQFQTWLTGANKLLADNYVASKWPANLPKDILIASEGERYIKVKKVREGATTGAAYAFIDRTNGDVLKAASWAAPAKHARGNLLQPDNGLGCVGPYGIAYLRG